MVWIFISLILVSLLCLFPNSGRKEECYWWAPKSLLSLDYSIKGNQRRINRVWLNQKIGFITNTYFVSAWGLTLVLLASFVSRISLTAPSGTHLSSHGVPTSKSDLLEAAVFCLRFAFAHMICTHPGEITSMWQEQVADTRKAITARWWGLESQQRQSRDKWQKGLSDS